MKFLGAGRRSQKKVSESSTAENQKIKLKGSFIQKYLPRNLLMHDSVKKQMLLPFIVTILVVGLIGGFFSYFYGKKMTRDQLTESTMQQLSATNISFDTYFGDAEASLRQFGASPLLTNPKKNNTSINQRFQNLIDANGKYQAITFASPNKYAIRAPLYFFNDNYDPTKDQWYQDGLRAGGKSYWISPYVDPVLKQQVVSVVQDVHSEGKSVGVIKMDLYIQNIINQVRSAKYGSTGYSSLLDRNGNYIATANKKQIGKSVKQQAFYKKIKTMGNKGMFYSRVDGQNKLVFFTRNKTTGWILLGMIDKSEISRSANLIALPSAVTMIIILLVAIFLTNYLLNKIVVRLRSIQKAAKQVQQGDLTVSIPIDGTDELADLMHSINDMARENREAFKKVTSASNKMSGASQTLVASAEENVASANEISATVTQISAGASNQSSALEKNQASIEALVQQIKTMDKRSKDVLAGADKMNVTSKNGGKIMQQLSTQSHASAETTAQIIAAVQELEQRAQNITQIVTVLDGIARRTNLLSLNASIEAAHAGDLGKGFAVVADEIRKLAQQTNTSLKEVSKTIHEVTEKTAQAVALGEKTNEMIQAQGKVVEQSRGAFAEIEQTIGGNVQGIHQIAGAIREVDAAIDQFSQGSQTIASTSEETAASTEEVSASVQEQTAAMEELNKLASDLEQEAQIMRQAISRFKI
ncbi:MAG: methyl-accepting chemotaxis protein [Sporolactobacillus sp.]